MDALEFESILRKVVREELAVLVAGGLPALPVLPVEPVAELLADLNHPYSLSDRELTALERRMTPQEMQILRKRCYAWRLAQQGNRTGAAAMRSKADQMEMKLAKNAA